MWVFLLSIQALLSNDLVINLVAGRYNIGKTKESFGHETSIGL
uniref:Protein canopy-1 n=1 Tax=Rhizophora mucronata TaxID=61149 RepID=A0A2P2KWP1_RHIMU